MPKPAFKPKYVLWVDLEMTGLDPVHDEILEIGAIATDWNFKEIATFEGVVHIAADHLKQLLDGNAVFWDDNPDARRGLEQQNEAGKPLEIVEADLLAWIDEHFDEGPVLLAGNSIHQDRQFIRQWWPRLEQRLHYRMLDVTSWKVVFEGKYGKKFAKPEAHRALSDIRGSIDELRYYLGKVKI